MPLGMMGDDTEEDFEARRALSVLREAEEIRMKSPPSLLARVEGELQKEMECLSRVSSVLAFTEGTPEEPPVQDKKFAGSDRLEDFFARMEAKGRKNKFLEAEDPEDRRKRILAGSKRRKFVGNQILAKFT